MMSMSLPSRKKFLAWGRQKAVEESESRDAVELLHIAFQRLSGWTSSSNKTPLGLVLVRPDDFIIPLPPCRPYISTFLHQSSRNL